MEFYRIWSQGSWVLGVFGKLNMTTSPSNFCVPCPSSLHTAEKITQFEKWCHWYGFFAPLLVNLKSTWDLPLSSDSVTMAVWMTRIIERHWESRCCYTVLAAWLRSKEENWIACPLSSWSWSCWLCPRTLADASPHCNNCDRTNPSNLPLNQFCFKNQWVAIRSLPFLTEVQM